MNDLKKEMFNPEQKNRYILYSLLTANTEDEDNYKKSLINFFKRLGAFENKFGQDFANLDFDSMKKLLNELINGAVGYQKNILSHLTQYVSWAIENKKTNLTANPLLGLKIEDLNLSVSYNNTMISSLEELVSILNKTLAPLEDDTVDNHYRAFYLLLFDGINVDEIVNLREDQINISEQSKFIKINDKIINISEATYDVVKYVLGQSSIKSSIKSGCIKEFQITKTGFLLENSRPISEKKDENYRKKYYNSFKVGLSKRMSSATKQLTPTKILLSGIFSRMLAKELNNEEISFSEYYEFKKSNMRTILSPGLVKREVEEEYRIWKESFS